MVKHTQVEATEIFFSTFPSIDQINKHEKKRNRHKEHHRKILIKLIIYFERNKFIVALRS